MSNLCPSSNCDSEDRKIIGVIRHQHDGIRVAYLKQPQHLTPELAASTSPFLPAQVFRIASTCLKENCQHHLKDKCSLAARVVKEIAAVTGQLPPCAIRSNCVWWKEQGAPACQRCPQILTENENPNSIEIAVAQDAEFFNNTFKERHGNQHRDINQHS